MKPALPYIVLLVFSFSLFLGCSNGKKENISSISNSDTRLVSVAEGYAATSVNAVIFRRNSLFTHGQTQFIAFYNPEGQMVLGKRTLGSDEWELHTTQYEGNVEDAHNSISIAVDGEGYLHVAWDHHNHPLRYARSSEPGGLQLGEREQPGSLSAGHQVTYPEFYPLPEGDLLLMYRDGSSGDGSQVLHRYHVEEGSWELLHDRLIDGMGEVNPYWQTAIDSDGTLHLSWNWRRHGGVETNHDLAYARSVDGGRTWEKSTGEPYELPITPGTAEIALHIPENSSMMNQTSMAADAQGRPYIVNYWKPEGSDIPQYHLVFHDGQQWQVSQVGQLTEEFDLQGGGTMAPPISRPQIVIDSANGRSSAWVIFRAGERGSVVSAAVSNDLESGEWQFRDLTELSVGSWEPSYDTELWRRDKILHLFVQNVSQRDHEQSGELGPQMVFVLEWEPGSGR